MTVKICVNTLHQIIVWIMTLSISAYPRKKTNLADMETATGFISYLIKFCFEWNVPTLDTMLKSDRRSR